ncbi:MAG: WYL domain-containing protein [Candidatus Falkowbacteria bacterium]
MNLIETIKSAAKEHLILKIIYRDRNGLIDAWRYIEPYSFSHDDGETGLFAWDIEKASIRRFLLDRIIEAELTNRYYNPRYKIEIVW